MRIRKTVLVVSMFLLSACSMYKSEFDCPAKRGVGCMSLSNVFNAVDDGTLGQHLGEEDAVQAEPLVQAQPEIVFQKNQKASIAKASTANSRVVATTQKS